MKPILIEYDPITGARMIPIQNHATEQSESEQIKKARKAFHNTTACKKAITAKRINNTKHK